MTAPLLLVSDITKSFGAVRALQGVSFSVMPGEVHALLGENGAGKSTLIKIIAGAHSPDSGTIEIGGKIARHLTPATAHRLGIACVYQQPALFPDLTVAENIAFRLEPIRPAGRVSWTARRSRAAQLLQSLGANISPDSEIRQLSMPEQQLVEIACAVGSGARVVIMDEPTSSLTQKEQHLLFKIVRTLRQSGAGVVYISHRLDEIFTLADRVTVLRDGQTVSTHPVSMVNETELIRLMVGREISQLFPPLTTAAAEQVVLRVTGLTSAAAKLHNVTFELRAGEIVGLAGLVGAGRTELARVLFGITPADSGEIHLNGHRIQPRSPQEAIAHGIAYVPEDRRRHGIILEMAVAANITLAIHPRIFPGGWLRLALEQKLAHEYIRNLDIKTPGPDAPGLALSGGNQQKVALARWLATQPQLLILDEPTQGVDVGAKSEIHKIIRQLAQSGLAVLMISSDLPEIIGMSDRILVMRGGAIAANLPAKSDPHQVMAAALQGSAP